MSDQSSKCLSEHILSGTSEIIFSITVRATSNFGLPQWQYVLALLGNKGFRWGQCLIQGQRLQEMLS